jgi:hypothetical protein
MKQTNNKKRQEDKDTHKKQQNERRKNRTEEHKWKHAKGNHVQIKPGKQIPSGIRK